MPWKRSHGALSTASDGWSSFLLRILRLRWRQARQPALPAPPGRGRLIARIIQTVTSIAEIRPLTHGSWVSGLLSSRQHAGYRRPAPSEQLSARTTREVDA